MRRQKNTLWMATCIVITGWLLFGCQELQQTRSGGGELSGPPGVVRDLQSAAHELEGIQNSLAGSVPDQEPEKYSLLLAVEYLRRARFTCIYVSQNLETLAMLRAEELPAYGQAKVKQIQAWQQALESSIAKLQLIYLDVVDDGARYQLDKADDILKAARSRLEAAVDIMSQLNAS